MDYHNTKIIINITYLPRCIRSLNSLVESLENPQLLVQDSIVNVRLKPRHHNCINIFCSWCHDVRQQMVYSTAIISRSAVHLKKVLCNMIYYHRIDSGRHVEIINRGCRSAINV